MTKLAHQKQITIMAAIYYHPEAYPPTINAITLLSKFAQIEILYRPHLENNWQFPESVHLHPSGNQIDIRDQEKSGLAKKITFFICFVWRLRRLIIKKNPNVLLLYDSIPLFAYRLLFWSLKKKPFIWYHSHDISEPNKSRKYSIGWWAAKSEGKIFPKIDLFTLPAIERIKYFPLNNLKGVWMFLPNLPLKSFYEGFNKAHKIHSNPVRLIYQGSISEGHGLESIIETLYSNQYNQRIELHLIGQVSDHYKQHLIDLAQDHNVLSQTIFHNSVPYKILPSITVSCDIGIAIHEPSDVIYQTGGTASNKIYEYAACGLPILFYKNEHYLNHLSKYKWAVPTDLNSESIQKSVNYIIDNYSELSEQAKSDFMTNLNFENHFSPVLTHLKSVINDKA